VERLTMKLAKDLSLQEAVGEAKAYLHAALVAGTALRIGHGSGPVHHFRRWWSV
jgi:hydroxymethylpyrimidine/phosphomethylpyrimidine kinase